MLLSTCYSLATMHGVCPPGCAWHACCLLMQGHGKHGLIHRVVHTDARAHADVTCLRDANAGRPRL